MIRINIDLTKIKESKKYRTGKNGRNYIDLVIQERKEPDRDGNTLAVSISKSKEEREAKGETIYVGAGKEFSFQQAPQTAQQQAAKNVAENTDDLPF